MTESASPTHAQPAAETECRSLADLATALGRPLFESEADIADYYGVGDDETTSYRSF